MDEVFSCLAFVYLMIAGYFTICFEWAFFTDGGFLAWAFFWQLACTDLWVFMAF